MHTDTRYVLATAESVSCMFEALALSAETLGNLAHASECHAKAAFVRKHGTGLAWRYSVPSEL